MTVLNDFLWPQPFNALCWNVGFPHFNRSDVLRVSISSDHHISSLQGDVVCRKHHPLQDQWHHRLSGLTAQSLGLQSKTSHLNYHFAKAISQWRWTPPADSKTNKWGLLSWSITTNVDCSTKWAPANSKHQLPHAWLFISFIHIIQELLHHKGFIHINVSVNMTLNGLSEYFVIHLINIFEALWQ